MKTINSQYLADSLRKELEHVRKDDICRRPLEKLLSMMEELREEVPVQDVYDTIKFKLSNMYMAPYISVWNHVRPLL